MFMKSFLIQLSPNSYKAPVTTKAPKVVSHYTEKKKKKKKLPAEHKTNWSNYKRRDTIYTRIRGCSFVGKKRELVYV